MRTIKEDNTRLRTYVSGPITKGDRNWNQAQANIAHKALVQAGFAVFNPIATGILPFAWDGDISHEEWLENCLPWVKVADMVLRLPGESVGADTEVAYARHLGIPVYDPWDFACLREWFTPPPPAEEAAMEAAA